MKEYYLMDKDSLENKGTVFGCRTLFRVSVLLLAALAVSLVLNLKQCVSSRRSHRDTCSMYEAMHRKSVDSMQADIDYAYTLVEECNLHSYIGRLFITKDASPKKTRDNVWEFIKELGVWYPEYIMAQAVAESGCGANTPSNSHNMFGMKVPVNRETTAINVGTGDIYAKYKNWELGVIDRVLWELHVFGYKKPSRKDYLKRLSAYAEDENYLPKIERIASEYRGK